MRPRSPRLGLVGLVVLALLGCAPGRSVVPVEPAADNSEGDFVLWGQILLPANPTPTAAPTAPTAAPTTAPAGEGTPTFAVHVTAASDYPDLNVAPPPGRPERYRCTARVSAQVTMSNGDTHHEVTWESSRPGMATVDPLGNVRGVGQTAGMVAITATSRDRKVSSSVWLRVTNFGDAEVVVN